MTRINFLSVVIPAYNEEKRIANTLMKVDDYFKKRKIKNEIIVINDGSTDDTENVLKLLKKKKEFTLLNNKRNRGKGYSVKKGILKSRGDSVLFTDADLSTPIEEFSKLEHWYSKGYKICIGSRRLPNSKIIMSQPFHRRLSGRVFGKVVQFMALRNIRDSQCGFKLFEGDTAKSLFRKQKLEGFTFDVEILYVAKKRGIKIKEIPITWVDSAKHSKVNVLKHSFTMFLDIIKINFFHG